jgi:hypothetical protein
LRKKKNEVDLPTFMIRPPKLEISEGDPEPDYVKKVDEFVERYYNGDYVVDVGKAFKIPYGIDGQESTLGHYLSFLVTEYVTSKTKTLADRYWHAHFLFQLITHAFAVGVIKEGNSLVTKLKKCEEGNKRLEEEYDKLKQEHAKLEEKYKELDDFVNKRLGGTGVIE